MTFIPISYVRQAPDRSGNSAIPIRTSIMSMEHAITWDVRIQPHIFSSPARADKYWSWALFRSVFPIAQYAKRRRRCLALTTLIRNQSGQAVPAAMSLFIERYPHLSATGQESVFVWFISSAPETALAHLGVKMTPSLGRALIDTALVASINMGLEGRIGLHCATAGGDRLRNFYLNHCKLNNLPKDATMPVGCANDGRFFYADEILAGSLVQELNPYR